MFFQESYADYNKKNNAPLQGQIHFCILNQTKVSKNHTEYDNLKPKPAKSVKHSHKERESGMEVADKEDQQAVVGSFVAGLVSCTTEPLKLICKQ